jgi:hypothetical protein
MDILQFKPKNILPEDVVDQLAEYWCDSTDTRDENLGEFIQRVAEIGIKYQAIIDKCIHI